MEQVKIYSFSDELEEKIANNFGKTKEMLRNDVQIVVEWMKTQPYFPEIMGKTV